MTHFTILEAFCINIKISYPELATLKKISQGA